MHTACWAATSYHTLLNKTTMVVWSSSVICSQGSNFCFLGIFLPATGHVTMTVCLKRTGLFSVRGFCHTTFHIHSFTSQLGNSCSPQTLACALLRAWPMTERSHRLTLGILANFPIRVSRMLVISRISMSCKRKTPRRMMALGGKSRASGKRGSQGFSGRP